MFHNLLAKMNGKVLMIIAGVAVAIAVALLVVAFML